MMMLDTPIVGELDILAPLNADHLQAQGLADMWIAVPGLMGGTRWYDVVSGQICTLTSMAFPPTSTSGWGSNATAPALSGEVRFDGTNDYGDLGTLGSYGSQMATNKPTVHIRFKVTTTNVVYFFGMRNASGQTRLDLRVNINSAGNATTGALLGILHDQSDNGITFGTAGNVGVSDGGWHDVLVAYDGPNQTGYMFVDGQAVTVGYLAQSATGTFANFNKSLFLGGFNDGSLLGPFQGAMASFALYNRLITSATTVRMFSTESLFGFPTLLNWLETPSYAGPPAAVVTGLASRRMLVGVGL